MIKEKMLELLLLELYSNSDDIIFEFKPNFDYGKFNKHLDELREEFLSPYVIDNNSKE